MIEHGRRKFRLVHAAHRYVFRRAQRTRPGAAFIRHLVNSRIAGEGKLAACLPARALIDDAANRVWIVLGTYTIEDDAGNAKLAFQRLAPRLKIDTHRKAATHIFKHLRTETHKRRIYIHRHARRGQNEARLFNLLTKENIIAAKGTSEIAAMHGRIRRYRM